MRRLLLFVLILLSINTYAQSCDYGDLTLIYINHTTDTPIDRLCARLDNEYKHACQYDKHLIIYLANGNKPYIASVGIDNIDTVGFDRISEALQNERYHIVDSRADVLNIMELFNENDFLKHDGTLKYNSMTWQFYVSQEFWNANYNEKIIAKLYYILDLPKISSDYLHLMIMCNRENELIYDNDNPWGLKNFCENLVKLEILNY